MVTGATSDIGAAIVRGLARAGADVALHTHSRRQRADDLAAELAGEFEGTFTVVQGDVGRIDEMRRIAAEAKAALGPITILVNVASTVRFERFLDSDPDDWEAVIRSTLVGAMNAAWTLAPDMIDAGGGRIVSITAEGALVGEPALAIASAAKAGVLGLTRTLAKDLARHAITVNAVSPGFVPTDSIPEQFRTPERLEKTARAYPAGRLATVEEVAAPVLFLCSPQASYVTGQTISVSGGYSVR